jgi:hypothetical protein
MRLAGALALVGGLMLAAPAVASAGGFSLSIGVPGFGFYTGCAPYGYGYPYAGYGYPYAPYAYGAPYYYPPVAYGAPVYGFRHAPPGWYGGRGPYWRTAYGYSFRGRH